MLSGTKDLNKTKDPDFIPSTFMGLKPGRLYADFKCHRSQNYTSQFLINKYMYQYTQFDNKNKNMEASIKSFLKLNTKSQDYKTVLL